MNSEKPQYSGKPKDGRGIRKYLHTFGGISSANMGAHYGGLSLGYESGLPALADLARKACWLAAAALDSVAARQ